MKAVLITDDKRLQLGEVDRPTPAADEVVIEVYATAVNRADLMQVDGCYPPPPGCPDWPGLEVAGVIAELGADVARSGKWQVGDKVCALLGGGGYAEYVAVPAGMVMPIPKGLSMVEAAALPEAFATAYLNLFYEGGAKPGHNFLMHAGASGLASVVIPMAKAFGLRVITTVLHEEAAKSIAHLGADVIVDTSKEDIVDVLRKEAEEGRPLNLAIDCLGSEKVGECFPYVAYMCKWIMIATLAGDISPVNMRTMFMKNIRLIGSTLRSKTPAFKAELLEKLVADIWSKVESGEVRPTIWSVLPIEQANEAHALLRDGKSAGKVVMTFKK